MTDDELLAVARYLEQFTRKPKKRRTKASGSQKATARARAGGQCEGCGGTTDLRVHHRIPACRGGTNASRNLVLLCRGCEDSAHRRLGI